MFKWSLSSKIIAILTATVGFFVIAALNGIIGNSSYYAFVLWLGGIIKFISLPWIITLVILLACFGFSFILWHHSRSAVDTLNHVLDLDDSLLRLLPSLIVTGYQEAEMQRLLKELLRDATRPFNGHVHRASILLPDSKKEYLKIWVHHQMSEESVSRTRFYIGQELDRIRGVAGETFLDAQLRVAHMRQENLQWKCDLDNYMDFDKKRPYPAYRSFVAIPIIGVISGSLNQTSSTCLGVACFDSDNLTIFDSQEIQYLLQVIGRRVASALLIYQQLQLMDGQLATGQTA
jgi:hypothetical protein